MISGRTRTDYRQRLEAFAKRPVAMQQIFPLGISLSIFTLLLPFLLFMGIPALIHLLGALGMDMRWNALKPFTDWTPGLRYIDDTLWHSMLDGTFENVLIFRNQLRYLTLTLPLGLILPAFCLAFSNRLVWDSHARFKTRFLRQFVKAAATRFQRLSKKQVLSPREALETMRVHKKTFRRSLRMLPFSGPILLLVSGLFVYGLYFHSRLAPICGKHIKNDWSHFCLAYDEFVLGVSIGVFLLINSIGLSYLFIFLYRTFFLRTRIMASYANTSSGTIHRTRKI